MSAPIYLIFSYLLHCSHAINRILSILGRNKSIHYREAIIGHYSGQPPFELSELWCCNQMEFSHGIDRLGRHEIGQVVNFLATLIR